MGTQEFRVTVPAPQLVSAQFIKSCVVIVEFDLTVTEVDSCSDAVDAGTLAKLGEGNWPSSI